MSQTVKLLDEDREEQSFIVPAGYRVPKADGSGLAPAYFVDGTEIITDTLQHDVRGKELAQVVDANLAVENIAKDKYILGVGPGTHDGANPISQQVGQLKYLIPVLWELTRYETRGFSLGTVTITVPNNPVTAVGVSLFSPYSVAPGSYGFMNAGILARYHPSQNHVLLEASLGFGSPSKTGTRVSVWRFNESSSSAPSGATSTRSQTIQGQSSDSSITYSMPTTAVGFIYVCESNYIGAPQILHTNSYITSTNTITVL